MTGFKTEPPSYSFFYNTNPSFTPHLNFSLLPRISTIFLFSLPSPSFPLPPLVTPLILPPSPPQASFLLRLRFAAPFPFLSFPFKRTFLHVGLGQQVAIGALPKMSKSSSRTRWLLCLSMWWLWCRSSRYPLFFSWSCCIVLVSNFSFHLLLICNEA